MLKKIEEALDDSEVDSRILKQLERTLKDQKAELKQFENDMFERMYDADETEDICDDEAKGGNDIMEKAENVDSPSVENLVSLVIEPCPLPDKAVEIKEYWGHVAGLVNPADIGSRGVSPSQLLINNLWWVGQNWLARGKENWPRTFPLTESVETRER